MPFGQTFEAHDLLIIGLLVLLEGVLSLDNALVLALLANRLPRQLRARALTYGLVGAFVFRILAICLAGFLLKWEWAKLLGGLYLLFVVAKHFFSGADESKSKSVVAATHMDFAHAASTHTRAFWTTVLVIELTDIAFAIDSIVAAVGLVAKDIPQGAKLHPKLWLVIVGGMLGVMVMRVAAAIFGRLLERFPRFEASAYLLVTAIGAKLVLDYFDHYFGWGLDFHNPRNLAFWAFWCVMLLSFAYGFIPHRSNGRSNGAAAKDVAANQGDG